MAGTSVLTKFRIAAHQVTDINKYLTTTDSPIQTMVYKQDWQGFGLRTTLIGGVEWVILTNNAAHF